LRGVGVFPRGQGAGFQVGQIHAWCSRQVVG
jgi:hypothetical protein